jgi:hypothetical protein
MVLTRDEVDRRPPRAWRARWQAPEGRQPGQREVDLEGAARAAHPLEPVAESRRQGVAEQRGEAVRVAGGEDRGNRELGAVGQLDRTHAAVL